MDNRRRTGQFEDDGKILQVVCISGDPVSQGIVDGHTIVCRIDSEPRKVDAWESRIGQTMLENGVEYGG